MQKKELLSLITEKVYKKISSLEKAENEKKAESEYFLLEKKVIDSYIIKKLYKQGYNKIKIKADSIITAEAKDFIEAKNICLSKKS
ncbi:hypothetical protein LJ207_03270 [Halanaerobium sp. Z-7514]|uniref:Uncharacterized protein n=1 Tax=Halanaerobium polyolivorans TaxID=2886943 RepID=A0AAW4WWY7_9FIRM|nr:hypothetical protein [Halanaerobium polyolivorans]MCC3144338.1 hypothetical protein [Halanaerobium polyolivorans]RQD69527.1 MAG: hypothetical protein D5S01_11190 [Halanaerobium sp. MSAO_Bac5]